MNFLIRYILNRENKVCSMLEEGNTLNYVTKVRMYSATRYKSTKC